MGAGELFHGRHRDDAGRCTGTGGLARERFVGFWRTVYDGSAGDAGFRKAVSASRLWRTFRPVDQRGGSATV